MTTYTGDNKIVYDVLFENETGKGLYPIYALSDAGTENSGYCIPSEHMGHLRA